MRPLLRIDPRDSVLEVVFEFVTLVLFSLLGIIMVCVLLGLFVFAVVSLVEGAVT